MQNDNPNNSFDDDKRPSLDTQPVPVTPSPSLDASAELASIESGEKMTSPSVAQVAMQQNTPTSNFGVQAPKKSRKGLWITLSAIVIAMVIIPAGGFAYWYTNVRVADIEYEKAIASVNAMIDAADGIEEYRESVKDGSTLTASSRVKPAETLETEALDYLNKLNTAKQKAAEFLVNEQIFAKLAVISKDASVKSVYDTSRKIIGDYGKSADEYYRTGHEFMTIMAYCQAGAKAIQEPGLDENKFSSDMKSCSERLTLSEALASKKFNDLIYTDYRNAFLGMISASKSLLAAKTQSQYDKAYDAMVQIQKDLDAIDTSRIDEIEPTQMPKGQLNRLKDKLEERRQVFFR